MKLEALNGLLSILTIRKVASIDYQQPINTIAISYGGFKTYQGRTTKVKNAIS